MRESDHRPTIVAFCCTWCTYQASDLAGTARLAYAPNARVIRVMCSGRVDPQFVLAAFHWGADGVLIGGCHPGDCHYQEGNYKALRRFTLLKKLAADMGIEDERLRLEWISAAEADKLKSAVDDMVERLRPLGPLRFTGETAGFTGVPPSPGPLAARSPSEDATAVSVAAAGSETTGEAGR